MNFWTKMSYDLANQKNYLDLLYRVYPISPNIRRELDPEVWNKIKRAFNNKDNKLLITYLTKLDLFPIKDSYVAYLRKDPSAIDRNPLTVNRITSQLYEMGLDEIFDQCTQPKEANRQIGPMFKEWIKKGFLGIKVFTDAEEFRRSKENGVLNVGDAEMKNYASHYLGYNRDKGLDFLARFNGTYVIGEAKFITDFGGHQDRQFDDAVETAGIVLNETKAKVISIAIMDGVLYIPNKGKYSNFMNNPANENKVIISSLLLREFLYSL